MGSVSCSLKLISTGKVAVFTFNAHGSANGPVRGSSGKAHTCAAKAS